MKILETNRLTLHEFKVADAAENIMHMANNILIRPLLLCDGPDQRDYVPKEDR